MSIRIVRVLGGFAALAATCGLGVAPATSAVVAAPPAGIVMTVTVAENVDPDPPICGTSSSIEVGPGTFVEFCYTVTNVGTVTYDSHSLVDTGFGPLLAGEPFSLAPGESFTVIRMREIVSTQSPTGTWTATNTADGASSTASASATVTVVPPSVELTMAVAAGHLASCPVTSREVTVAPGDEVTICSVARNTGRTTLSGNVLSNSHSGEVGALGSLEPGRNHVQFSSFTVDETETITGTWTGSTPFGTQVSDSDVISIVVAAPPSSTEGPPTPVGSPTTEPGTPTTVVATTPGSVLGTTPTTITDPAVPVTSGAPTTTLAGTLPATGSTSGSTAVLAALLLAAGVSTVALASRTRRSAKD